MKVIIGIYMGGVVFAVVVGDDEAERIYQEIVLANINSSEPMDIIHFAAPDLPEQAIAKLQEV